MPCFYFLVAEHGLCDALCGRFPFITSRIWDAKDVLDLCCNVDLCIWRGVLTMAIRRMPCDQNKG